MTPPTRTSIQRRRRPVHVFGALLASALMLLPAGVADAKAKVRHPRRIVSLSPTATEDLYAIGAGPHVVAVDDQSDFPKAAPQTRLTGIAPNLESIAKLHPDLVVAQYDPGKLASGLKRLHVRLVLLPSAENLDDAYAQITTLGAETDHVANAASVTSRMRTKLAKVVASVPRQHGRRVLHEVSPDLYAASSHSFAGKVYALFGLRNVADAADRARTGYPQLSSEYVMQSNPGLIVLADHGCCHASRASLARRSGWSGIDAVRHHGVVVINDDVASRWGPRVVDFAQGVANGLNGVS